VSGVCVLVLLCMLRGWYIKLFLHLDLSLICFFFVRGRAFSNLDGASVYPVESRKAKLGERGSLALGMVKRK